MIVQCPSCTSRYRVNAANIPATGGKIRCPSCSHAFAVYPEPAPDPDPVEDAENKTSIAERPNLQQLLSQMRQGGAAHPGATEPDDDDGDEAQTEVMQSDSLPDFSALFGGNAPETDSTVEMANPLFRPQPGGQGAPAPRFEDDIATQELNADIVAASLQHVREQAQSKPGISDISGIRASGQAPPLPLVGQPPSPGQQRRISASAEPTPPPSPSRSQRMPPSMPPPLPPPGAPGMGTGPAPPQAPSPQSSPLDFGSTPASEDAASAADGAHEGPWKLQTNFGLTYEFADNKSLRNWLDSRDDLDGFKLSADGENFLPISDFPQIQKAPAPMSTMANRAISSTGSMAPVPGPDSSLGSGPRPTASGAPFRTAAMPGVHGDGAPARSPFTTALPAVGGPGDQGAEPPRERINPNQSYRPPSRDGGALNKILWATFAILVIAALVVGVYLLDGMGVIDILDRGDGAEQEIEQVAAQPQKELPTEAAGEPVVEEVDEEAIRARQEQQFQRVLDDARDDLDSNRLTSAQDRLESALLLDPKRAEIYEMKATIHEKLGESDKAKEMSAKAEQLRLERAESAGSEPPSE